MDPSVSNPFLPILFIGGIAFLAGAGSVLALPRHQPALRWGAGAIAAVLLALDFSGHQLVPFGFGIDPAEIDGVVPISSLMGPRIAFFGFLGGVLSFAINQRLQSVIGLVVAGTVILGPRLFMSMPAGV